METQISDVLSLLLVNAIGSQLDDISPRPRRLHIPYSKSSLFLKNNLKESSTLTFDRSSEACRLHGSLYLIICAFPHFSFSYYCVQE